MLSVSQYRLSTPRLPENDGWGWCGWDTDTEVKQHEVVCGYSTVAADVCLDGVASVCPGEAIAFDVGIYFIVCEIFDSIHVQQRREAMLWGASGHGWGYRSALVTYRSLVRTGAIEEGHDNIWECASIAAVTVKKLKTSVWNQRLESRRRCWGGLPSLTFGLLDPGRSRCPGIL